MAIAVLALIGVGLLAWQQPWDRATGPEPPEPFPVDAAAQLTERATALTAATEPDQLADALGTGEVAQAWGREIFAAQQELNITDVTWRYISGGDRAVFDDGDGRAAFSVNWGDDESAEVQIRVEPLEDGQLDLLDVVAADDPLPLWLAGAISIENAEGLRIVRVDGGDPTLALAELGSVAKQQVAAVEPQATATLTLISAPSQAIAAALLGRPAEDLQQIAAVSTSRDRRDGKLTGDVVVLNPAAFTTMNPRATQIVMTHEATHVLTGGVGSSVETWVAEGFADFVALRQDTAPLQTSAGQILRQVQRVGAPEALPTADEFAGTTGGLGAVYESAWLAMQMLAEEHGDAAVIGFYQDLVAGSPVEQSAQARFGQSIEDITEDWRDYLVERADELN